MSARTTLAPVVVVVVATAATWALAAPTATGEGRASAADATSVYGEPHTRCTVTDRRLPEISGATVVDGELLVANDKGARFYALDDRCDVSPAGAWVGSDAKDATPLGARDVEDLTVGPDGTVWLVDSGGNRTPRSEVSLLGVTPEGTSVELTFAYPSGTHDAEAAVVTADLQLVLFTKSPGTSTVFTARIPAADPVADVTGPVELTAVGSIDLTGLADPATGGAGLVVTGAALSPDGQHVAVRTAAEIFEWRFDGADPAAEVVAERPARVARVEQRQGEAVTYSADGSQLLALSEQLPAPVLAVDLTRTAGPGGGAAGAGVPDWGYGLVGGATGALVVLLAMSGWRRRPRGRATAGAVPAGQEGTT